MIRILLVGNNDFVRSGILSKRLKRQGFEVACAFDGEQAVEIAHSEEPDLILMDMSLPVK